MSSLQELSRQIAAKSKELRDDMRRLLPSPSEQADRLEKLIEISGQPTGGWMDE